MVLSLDALDAARLTYQVGGRGQRGHQPADEGSIRALGRCAARCAREALPRLRFDRMTPRVSIFFPRVNTMHAYCMPSCLTHAPSDLSAHKPSAGTTFAPAFEQKPGFD